MASIAMVKAKADLVEEALLRQMGMMLMSYLVWPMAPSMSRTVVVDVLCILLHFWQDHLQIRVCISSTSPFSLRSQEKLSLAMSSFMMMMVNLPERNILALLFEDHWH